VLDTSVFEPGEDLVCQFLRAMLRPDGFATVVKIQSGILDSPDGCLPLFRVKRRIDTFPETADVIGAVHARRFQVLCLGLIEVPDVDDDLSFSRNPLTHYPHDVNQAREIERVHSHKEKGVEVSRTGEVAGTAEDILVAHYTRLECRVALTEAAERAPARTAGNLDADLRKDNAFIVEPSSRDGVANGAQKGSFEGRLRELIPEK